MERPDQTSSRQRVHEATARLRARLRRGHAHRIQTRRPVPTNPLWLRSAKWHTPAIHRTANRGLPARPQHDGFTGSPATTPRNRPRDFTMEIAHPPRTITGRSKIARVQNRPVFRVLHRLSPGATLAMVRFPACDRHYRSAREIFVFLSGIPGASPRSLKTESFLRRIGFCRARRAGSRDHRVSNTPAYGHWYKATIVRIKSGNSGKSGQSGSRPNSPDSNHLGRNRGARGALRFFLNPGGTPIRCVGGILRDGSSGRP